MTANDAGMIVVLLCLVAVSRAEVYIEPASPPGWAMGIFDNQLAAFWASFNDTDGIRYATTKVVAGRSEADVQTICATDVQCKGYKMTTSPLSALLYLGDGSQATRPFEPVVSKSSGTATLVFTTKPSSAESTRHSRLFYQQTFAAKSVSRTLNGIPIPEGTYVYVDNTTTVNTFTATVTSGEWPFPIVVAPILDPELLESTPQEDTRPITASFTVLSAMCIAWLAWSLR